MAYTSITTTPMRRSRQSTDKPSRGDDRIRHATERLAVAGYRLTRSRLLLCELLFNGEDRHVTADMLFLEGQKRDSAVSLATIYNALREFSDAGILRPIRVDGLQSCYDTDVSEHQHFYVEDDRALIDVPSHTVRIDKLPSPPQGYVVDYVNVVVRLRRKSIAPLTRG
jgi:Fur family transcriptional regulator, iron response regulator